MSYDLGTAHGRIVLDYDGGGGVRKAENDIDRLERKSKTADKETGKLSKTLSGLGKGAGFAGIAVSATNAAASAAALGVQVLGIVPNLLSIGSLAAGLPAAFTAGAAAIGVVKASFAGFDDVMKVAFDPSKTSEFNEALKKLAPEAQNFAKAIRESSPALKTVQQEIQNAFFGSASLDKAIPVARDSLLGLSPVLRGLASDFGNITKRVTDFALSSDSFDFVSTSIQTLRDALNNASPALEPLLTGLRDVGTVGQTLLAQLGTSVGDVGSRFGEFLTQISNDGRLEGWIETAKATLGTLGGIIQNVGSILNSVFTTAAATGGGLLNNIEQITGQFATFLKSAEGSQAITSLFSGIMQVAQQLAPVFTTLAGALAGALGPALTQIATEVGPVLLNVVNQLAPAFGPLAQAIADILSAVAPLAEPLAQLVSQFAQLAAGGISTLATNLQPVVAILGEGLTGALTALQPAIEAALANLPAFAAAGTQLATALAPLLPQIVQLAAEFAGAFVENLPQITANVLQLVPAFVQLTTALVTLISAGLTTIMPLIPTLVALFVQFQGAILGTITVITGIVTAVANLITWFAQLPGTVGTALSTFGTTVSTAFTTALGFVTSIGSQIVNWFVSLPGRIGGALASLPGTIGGFVSSAVQQMAFRFGQGIGIAVSLAATLPSRVVSAAAALPGQLRGLAANAWNAVKAAFSSGVNAAAGLAKSLPGRARSAISALAGGLRSIAVSAWNALKGAFSSGVSAAAGVARTLPGRIRSAVGNLGGLLVSAGRDAVLGLANGIKGAVGAAVSAAASVGRSVINGVKSTLKINSPSRVMITIGRYVTQGLYKGLLSDANSIKSAANKLANYVTDAFNTDTNKKKKGTQRLISAKQKNSVLATLAAGTKQLDALVKKSNDVAARLKTAQENLKKAQDAYNESFANAKKSVTGAFDLVSPGQGFVDIKQTKQRFQDTVNQAKQFTKDIQALVKRGLNKDLIQQLLDAGVEGGSVMARALANGSAQDIKDFNNLQNQLNAEGDKVGKTIADKYYGAGVRAAQGLVNGLNSQAKAIDKQAERIANSMIKAIKKALKIKSPSRLTFEVGKFTTQGLIDGLRSLRTQVQRAATSVADSAVAPTLALGAARTVPLAALTGRIAQSTAQAAPASVNQNVYALPGMSPKQVADYGLTKLTLALTTGVGAVTTPAPATQGVA